MKKIIVAVIISLLFLTVITQRLWGNPAVNSAIEAAGSPCRSSSEPVEEQLCYKTTPRFHYIEKCGAGRIVATRANS